MISDSTYCIERIGPTTAQMMLVELYATVSLLSTVLNLPYLEGDSQLLTSQLEGYLVHDKSSWA